MEQLKNIKHCLVSTVQTQLGDLKHVDAKELGEVIDMIKDLEEAMYYCSIIEAMEKVEKERETSGGDMNISYYMEPMYYRGQPRDSMGRYTSGGGRRNYSDGGAQSSNSGSMGGNSSTSGGGSRYYVPYMEYAPYMMRDSKWRDERFGDMPNDKSSWSRHMYMENKQYKGNDESSMEDLEHYIKDLGEDLTDMVRTSTTEEKQLLSTKLQQLASKINK